MLIKKARWLKISTEMKWRLITYLVAGLMIAGVFISGVFIYRYIYVTLDNANAVMILNTNTSINVIDVPTFNKAIQILDSKLQPPAIMPARNIFSYASSTPPVTLATSSPGR